MIRRSAVSIGRSSDTKGDVDVDLSKAAAAASGPAAGSTPAAAAAGGDGGGLSVPGGVCDVKKVSRLQAQLSLELNGNWVLHNTGRAGLVVNGSKVGSVFCGCQGATSS